MARNGWTKIASRVEGDSPVWLRLSEDSTYIHIARDAFDEPDLYQMVTMDKATFAILSAAGLAMLNLPPFHQEG